MAKRFSKEAMERPHRTIKAMEIVREQAQAIARVAADARENEDVVVIVQKNMTFGGVWTLMRSRLIKQIKLVEDKGDWSIIFSPKTSAEQIEERCNGIARLASRRLEGMKRWTEKHPEAS